MRFGLGLGLGLGLGFGFGLGLGLGFGLGLGLGLIRAIGYTRLHQVGEDLGPILRAEVLDETAAAAARCDGTEGLRLRGRHLG
jgi:hypothetical protein